jgi:AraC-like DNA-binding protein
MDAGGIALNIQMKTYGLNSIYEETCGFVLQAEQEPGQIVYELPFRSGSGSVRRTCLRSGMDISWYEATLEEAIAIDVDVRYPHLEIAFTWKGQGSWESDEHKQYGEMAPGVSSLVYMGDKKVRAELMPGEAMSHMELRFDLRQFQPIYDEMTARTRSSFYCSQLAGSPHVAHLADQLKHCPYTGALRQLYLEGKAFELLVVHLDAADGDEKRSQSVSKLNADDIRCLHRAKELLNGMWREPPSLLELARMAGINDYKLKLGFKELFGTTVFGYVRGLRMNEARRILEQGQANVSEAAVRVGYSNMGYFSSLYRKTFGYNPSEAMLMYQRNQTTRK